MNLNRIHNEIGVQLDIIREHLEHAQGPQSYEFIKVHAGNIAHLCEAGQLAEEEAHGKSA